MQSEALSREKLYEELGLESLQLRHWFRKLSCFYKLFNSKNPYLFKLIPSRIASYAIRNMDNIPFFKTHSFLKNSFFPSTVIEWNDLDHNIRNSSSFNIFRRSILKFIRPSANSFFNCHNPKGIKFITRLRLGLSHLREHKFKHSFQDSLNPFCSCGLDIESTGHYLLHCPTYTTERRTLLSTIENIDSNFIDIPEPVLIEILFFGSNSIDANANTHVLNAIYLLKDLKNRSFNEVNKFSNKVMNQ